jgi:hypothetical protein
MCSEKFSYSSQDEAIVVGQRRLGGVRRLFWYRCPECGHFHLTRGEKMPSLRAKLHAIPSAPVTRQISGSLGTTIGELLLAKRQTI